MRTCEYCGQHIVAPGDHVPSCMLAWSLNVHKLNRDAVGTAAVLERMEGNQRRPLPELYIPDQAWDAIGDQDEGDPRSWLLAQVQLNNRQCHASAFEVRYKNKRQVAVHPGCAAELDHWTTAADGSSPLATTTIAGREYVVFIYPHAD